MAWYLRPKTTGLTAFSNGYTITSKTAQWRPNDRPSGVMDSAYLPYMNGARWAAQDQAFDVWGWFAVIGNASAQPIGNWKSGNGDPAAEFNAADGTIFSTALPEINDGQQIKCRIGWLVNGILMIEILTTGTDPLKIHMGGNLYADGSTQRGVVAKDFTGPASGDSYRMYTNWSNRSSMNDFSSGQNQVTRTLVPVNGAEAVAAAGNTLTVSVVPGFADYERVLSRDLTVGAVLYLQWGKATVDAVQTWIIANLEETSTHPFATPDVRGYQVVNEPAQMDFGWPTGDPLSGVVVNEPARYDSVDSGSRKIEGTVAIDDSPDIPVARRVRLYDKPSGRLVRETWSATDGTYSFEKLREGKFFLISHDHTLNENAAVRDEIESEVPA